MRKHLACRLVDLDGLHIHRTRAAMSSWLDACPPFERTGFESRSATLAGSRWSRCQRFGIPWKFGLSGGIWPTWSVVCGVLAASCPSARLDHNFQRVLWFITEVRSLQDLRQQEDR